MTNKRGTVKLLTFSLEMDAPNIISCAPKMFSCAPKNLHLVAQVLPNSNLNFISALGTFRRVKKRLTLGEKKGCFLVLWKILLVCFYVVLWVLFIVFSIFCTMSFGDCTRLHHQETTVKREPSHLEQQILVNCHNPTVPSNWVQNCILATSNTFSTRTLLDSRSLSRVLQIQASDRKALLEGSTPPPKN